MNYNEIKAKIVELMNGQSKVVVKSENLIQAFGFEVTKAKVRLQLSSDGILVKFTDDGIEFSLKSAQPEANTAKIADNNAFGSDWEKLQDFLSRILQTAHSQNTSANQADFNYAIDRAQSVLSAIRCGGNSTPVAKG